MSIEKMEVEITLGPAKARRGGRKAGLKVDEQPRIPRITRLMALAIKFQSMIDRGEVRDQADIARLGYVTRARLTQIMNLLLLAPDLQADIVAAQAEGLPEISERHLRDLTRIPAWEPQRRLWRELRTRPLTQG